MDLFLETAGDMETLLAMFGHAPPAAHPSSSSSSSSVPQPTALPGHHVPQEPAIGPKTAGLAELWQGACDEVWPEEEDEDWENTEDDAARAIGVPWQARGPYVAPGEYVPPDVLFKNQVYRNKGQRWGNRGGQARKWFTIYYSMKGDLGKGAAADLATEVVNRGNVKGEGKVKGQPGKGSEQGTKGSDMGKGKQSIHFGKGKAAKGSKGGSELL